MGMANTLSVLICHSSNFYICHICIRLYLYCDRGSMRITKYQAPQNEFPRSSYQTKSFKSLNRSESTQTRAFKQILNSVDHIYTVKNNRYEKQQMTKSSEMPVFTVAVVAKKNHSVKGRIFTPGQLVTALYGLHSSAHFRRNKPSTRPALTRINKSYSWSASQLRLMQKHAFIFIAETICLAGGKEELKMVTPLPSKSVRPKVQSGNRQLSNPFCWFSVSLAVWVCLMLFGNHPSGNQFNGPSKKRPDFHPRCDWMRGLKHIFYDPLTVKVAILASTSRNLIKKDQCTEIKYNEDLKATVALKYNSKRSPRSYRRFYTSLDVI